MHAPCLRLRSGIPVSGVKFLRCTCAHNVMKTSIAIAIVFCLSPAFSLMSGAQTVSSSNRPSVSGNNGVASAMATSPCSQTEDLLKYQQFLRKEGDEASVHLDRLIQDTERQIQLLYRGLMVIGGAAGGLFLYFGHRTHKELRENASTRLTEIDSRAKEEIRRVLDELQSSSRASVEGQLKRPTREGRQNT